VASVYERGAYAQQIDYRQSPPPPPLPNAEAEWLACQMCNSHKADRQEALDPESRAMVPLFNPRAARWEEHFEWIEAGTMIRGKTAQGRATVVALQMNHQDIVATRRLWVIAGWYPPTE
jgi:hypothetical protein